MIASIRGTLLFVSVDHAVVETGGVGFQIFAPRNVLGSLGEIGSEVRFYTHLHIREDLLALYGFASTDQRHLFETLLGVSGIGPKVALSLLSSASSDELRAAIAGGDTARLSRVPGIGKKTAERLVLELRGKLEIKGGAPIVGATPAVMAANAELAEMLVSLGFSAAEANAAIAALPADAPPAVEDRLRLALRYFGGA
ncbi:ATP-dependent DNA helicase RuvA [Kouleothrix aurantiaca]|uniref:Holliday junction branch migration complex subunit RuvA n=1 Tax=Kouleothrix aurantiaca TaxID=186479 RepID=A0A0P9D7P7_9CHLR|nr:ATP-dependent DNA helicase RuvA [Kouleothrix aurantiaca]